eukprot:UN25220
MPPNAVLMKPVEVAEDVNTQEGEQDMANDETSQIQVSAESDVATVAPKTISENAEGTESNLIDDSAENFSKKKVVDDSHLGKRVIKKSEKYPFSMR